MVSLLEKNISDHLLTDINKCNYWPLRLLDTVFQGKYLFRPKFELNHVAINKDLEKLQLQLY